jgi:hypothetical protein
VSPRSTTITAEGRDTRRNIETLVFTLVVVAVIGWAITEFGRQQTGAGPNGSVFVTDVNGAAAIAELFDGLGHPVIPVTAPFDSLDSGGTVLILDPSVRQEFGPDEVEALRSWVADGGRLIISGRPHPDLLDTLLPADLMHGFDGRQNAPIVTPLRGVDGSITTDGIVTVRSDEPYLVLAGEPPVAVAFSIEDGEVVYVADGSVFWNGTIAGNAAWVTSLIAEGPVRFDEVRHGFEAAPVSESPAGLTAALPEGARNALLLLLPVLVVGLVTYGRRFGPPEQAERVLAPPRRELVDAMAGLLSRLPEPLEAAEPVKRRLRSTLAAQAGLPADASDDMLVSAAGSLGLDPDEVESLLEPDDEVQMLAAQHMLARLSEREHQ